jgi:hypothetical protein
MQPSRSLIYTDHGIPNSHTYLSVGLDFPLSPSMHSSSATGTPLSPLASPPLFLPASSPPLAAPYSLLRFTKEVGSNESFVGPV